MGGGVVITPPHLSSICDFQPWKQTPGAGRAGRGLEGGVRVSSLVLELKTNSTGHEFVFQSWKQTLGAGRVGGAGRGGVGFGV